MTFLRLLTRSGVGAALLGGLPVALGAVVIACLLADFYFVSPRHTFAVAGVVDVLELASFVGIGLVVAVLLESTAVMRRRAADTSAEAAVLAVLVASVVRHLGSPAYHARNRWMVDRSELVIGFPRGTNQAQGTWYTLN
ncbi:DUF4118 domain-containing protein [Amycolatopsis sp. RTGN1]|uniref:DUF4118 domain-containing protein n=1 Tax=Amycolatopsis ponsaeliensis TaxID=2992142 RepID=UPI00254AB19F|nr:DUF4118 domain-containing protein [Amycolatopsis sp. RTGN1]